MTIRFLPLVAAALVVGLAGCGAAPGPVQEAFDQRYPGFEEVVWERQPYGWEAAFGGDDGAYEAEFDAAGRQVTNDYEDA